LNYYQVSIESSSADNNEIIIAELSQLPFDTFEEEGNIVKAYIPENLFIEAEILATLSSYKDIFSLTIDFILIHYTNWNEVWESNYQPVYIADKLQIIANFHIPKPNYSLTLLIHPKMSFGTGHHATTSLVAEYLLELDLKDKNVLDLGTGTGILAILAKKKGAAEVIATDIDPQCIENAAENIQLNGTEDIKLLLTNEVPEAEKGYDIIIGNITRNVILEYLPNIARSLPAKGVFIASGFYKTDLTLLKENAKAKGLELKSNKEKESWCAALFEKNK